MPRKAQARNKVNSLPVMVETVQPLITLAAVIGGFVVWTYSTFAQIGHVEKIYAEIQENQRLLKEDAHSYSDSNREKNLLITLDLKESVKELKEQLRGLETRLLTARGYK